MKNAAKCDSWREMQKSVNVEFSNLTTFDSGTILDYYPLSELIQ